MYEEIDYWKGEGFLGGRVLLCNAFTDVELYVTLNLVRILLGFK